MLDHCSIRITNGQDIQQSAFPRRLKYDNKPDDRYEAEVSLQALSVNFRQCGQSASLLGAPASCPSCAYPAHHVRSLQEHHHGCPRCQFGPCRTLPQNLLAFYYRRLPLHTERIREAVDAPRAEGKTSKLDGEIDYRCRLSELDLRIRGAEN